LTQAQEYEIYDLKPFFSSAHFRDNSSAWDHQASTGGITTELPPVKNGPLSVRPWYEMNSHRGLLDEEG